MSEAHCEPSSSASSAVPCAALSQGLPDYPADGQAAARVDNVAPEAAHASHAGPVASAITNMKTACRCEVCGVSGFISNFYSPRFCSRECRYERNKGNHVLPRPDIGIITCRECGKVGSSTEFFSAKYCSKKCRYERGGRPAPLGHAIESGATSDSAALAEARHKVKRDMVVQQSAPLPFDSNANAPRASALPMPPAAIRVVNNSTLYPLHSSAAAHVVDSSSNHVAATVAANWQLLADYQPRDKDHPASLSYLLDAVAALQESIVHASLDCARAETLLEATHIRLQELENDIAACSAGAADAESVEDRKSYHDIIRKMWTDRALLQKDELRMLEQLRKQLEGKSRLRQQLLDKQQALLTLGLTLSRRACRCPVSGCACFHFDSILALRSHMDKAHGMVMQDVIDSQGWNAFISDIMRKPSAGPHNLVAANMRQLSKPAFKGASYGAATATPETAYATHVSDLVSRIRTENFAAPFSS